MFDRPVIEFTTKLERFDRPLTHQEARELSGLNEREWLSLLSTTEKIALKLKGIFAAADVTLWDGKVEFAAGEYRDGAREIILVDSIGPDELRLTKNSTQLSKEIIRQYYRQTNWYAGLEAAKEKHGAQFKEFYPAPPALPKEFKHALEEMYQLLPLFLLRPESAELKFQKLLPSLRRFA